MGELSTEGISQGLNQKDPGSLVVINLSPIELYALITSKQVEATQIDPGILLRKGTEAVGLGNLGLRDALYSFVRDHPAATPEQTREVEIHDADALRRQNTSEALSQAFDRLTALTPSDNPYLEALRLQALSQVHLYQYLHTKDSEELKKGLGLAREIIGLLDDERIDIPKRAFYLSSFVSFKQQAGEYDDALFAALDTAERYVASLPDNSPFKLRELSQIQIRVGGVQEHLGRNHEALRAYYRSYQLGPTDYYKLDGAFAAIKLADRLDLNAEDAEDKMLAEVRQYISGAIARLSPQERASLPIEHQV